MPTIEIPCVCDETPHEKDAITFREKMDSHRALIITKSVGFIETTDERIRPAEVLATMSELYVLLGVESWTLVTGTGKPMPVIEENLRERLLETDAVADIVEFADGLYSEAVLLPLVRRVLASSPATPTETPTSPRRAGGQPRPRKPSKRSSISTIPTGGTETTSSSLAGVSSFSPSSESAA